MDSEKWSEKVKLTARAVLMNVSHQIKDLNRLIKKTFSSS